MTFDRDDALKNAEKFVRLGRLDAALAEYERMVTGSPDDWKTLALLADLYVRTNQPERATPFFARIADHLAEQGFLQKAEAFYKRILKVDPADEHALSQLASIAIAQGILVEAKAHLAALARARQVRGDSRASAEAILQIGTLDPTDLRARCEAARAAAGAGNHDLGAAELGRVAAALSAADRHDEALDVLREAVTIAPADQGLRERLTDELIARGDVESLGSLAATAVDSLAIADKLAAAGHADAAARMVEDAGRRAGDDGAVAARMFVHYLDRGRRDDAEPFARTADAWAALAAAHHEAGDLDRALSAADAALGLDPTSREAALRRVRLMAARGDAAGAAQQLEQLGDVDEPGLQSLQLGLWLRSGRLDQARIRLDHWLQAGRLDDAGIQGILAAVPEAAWPVVEVKADRAFASGEGAEAAELLKQFVASHRDHILALVKLVEVAVDAKLVVELTPAQDALCAAYLAEGRGVEARVIAEDLVARAPRDPGHRRRLREALALAGDPDPDRTVERFVQAAVGDDPPAGEDVDSGLASGTGSPETVSEGTSAGHAAGADSFRLGPGAIDLAAILGDDRKEAAAGPASGAPEPPEIDLSAIIRELKPHIMGPAGKEKGSRMPDRPEPPSLDEVFRDFRDEVSRQTASDDADRHYKVALTYRDMGMVDDAVRELELAARAPRLRFDASALLARLLRDRGEPATAVEWFERAAEAPAPTSEAGRQLLYELGQVLETTSETARALAVYLELQADAGDYRDVAARVERLARVQTEG